MNQDQKTIDELSDDFRKLWRQKPISVEDFLSQSSLSGETSSQIAIRLIKHEIELRRSAGESCSATEYKERFPNVDTEVLSNLISMPAPPPVSVLKPLLPKRYEPIKQIGKGGIGSVWQVDDRDMERTLAVKVLHSKFEKDNSANMRLRREAMLTGLLQHPGIPPVFEYGSLVGGSHYFAMKLVEGETLDRVFSKLSQTELLSVFRQIAEAVGFAHSKNVIHRDLKPQNVMVGAFGEVQIMDWGMARRLDCDEPVPTNDHHPLLNGSKTDTVSAHCDESVSEKAELSLPHELTRVGEILGTPAYMAPEQARGESDRIDARSDVFGLGAILFAMLTGKRLYDGHSAADMISVAAKGDLKSAFLALNEADLDDELRDLCKDCLQPQSCDRPADASVVAERIGDYQNNVQKRLRRAELDQQATLVKADEQKKRTRAISWLSGLAILLTTAGLIGVTWQWNKTIESQNIAKLESKRAQGNFSQLLEAVDKMLSKVGDESLDNIPYMKEVRKDLLQDALKFYQGILAQTDDSPQVQLEVAEANRRVGKIYSLLGEFEDSRVYLDRAIELLDPLTEFLPQLEVDRPKAECLRLLANLEEELGNLDSAESNYKRASEVWSELVAAFPDDKSLPVRLARSLRLTGRVYTNQGQLDNARDTTEQAIEFLLPTLDEKTDDDILKLRTLASCYQGLGSIEEDEGNNEPAEEYYQKAVDVLTPFTKSPTESDEPVDEKVRMELSQYLNNLAGVQRFIDKSDEAAANHLINIELRKQLVKDFPSTPEYRNFLATSYCNLGIIYKLDKRIDDATELYDQAIDILRELTDEFPKVPSWRFSLGATLHNTANMLEVSVRDESAIKRRHEAIAEFSKLKNDNPETPLYQHALGLATNDLAVQLERRGEILDAFKANLEAIEIRADLVKRFPDNNPYLHMLAVSEGFRGWLLAMSPDPELRDPEMAIKKIEIALAHSTGELDNVRAHGAALYRLGKFPEAIEKLMELKPEESEDAAILYLLSLAHFGAEDRESGAEWLKRADELVSKSKELPDVNLEPIIKEVNSRR